jgi:hypothetical protein
VTRSRPDLASMRIPGRERQFSTPVTLLVTPDLYDAVRSHAKRRGISMSAYFREGAELLIEVEKPDR